MATLPDVKLTGMTYQDVYAETGITSGVSVSVQNKSSNAAILQNTADQPDAGSYDGFLLMPGSMIILAGTIFGLWAKGIGPITVEAVT